MFCGVSLQSLNDNTVCEADFCVYIIIRQTGTKSAVKSSLLTTRDLLPTKSQRQGVSEQKIKYQYAVFSPIKIFKDHYSRFWQWSDYDLAKLSPVFQLYNYVHQYNDKKQTTQDIWRCNMSP